MNIQNYKRIINELKLYPQNPKLLAVTKYSDYNEINNAIKHGITAIGENRIEIAEEKFEKLNTKVEKHFIGVIQTKKLKKIFELFDVIESIGNIKQLNKINQIAEEKQKIANIFLQFNISNEQQKSGFKKEDIPEIIKISNNLKSINISGIMGMASIGEESEIRKEFKFAKEIFENLKKEITSIKELSIGMSSDYKIALEYGATIIRIGSALFK